MDEDDLSTATELVNNLTKTREEGGIDNKEREINISTTTQQDKTTAKKQLNELNIKGEKGLFEEAKKEEAERIAKALAEEQQQKVKMENLAKQIQEAQKQEAQVQQAVVPQAPSIQAPDVRKGGIIAKLVSMLKSFFAMLGFTKRPPPEIPPAQPQISTPTPTPQPG